VRLGFHYHIPAALIDGLIRTAGPQGRFMDALAEHCAEIVCFLHTPVRDEFQRMDYVVQQRNVRLVGLGPHASVPRRLLSARRYARTLREAGDNLDVLLLRGPSPLLPLLARAVRPLPTSLLLVGDAVAGVSGLPQPFWRKTAIRLLWKWNRRQQDRVAQRALTFVNSRKLFLELQTRVPNLVETRTTTLSKTDFYRRDDTCAAPPYRLLYTGRLDRTKGLLDMVEAVAILVQAGLDVVLDLVGFPQKGDPVLDDIKNLAASKGILERVNYLGYKSLGSELFGCYKVADVFVIASQASEGFPRTIWEAMAHSVPVVATAVGSIPHFVGQAAAVVQPNDCRGLASAIQTVLLNGTRRREMISLGCQLASAVTLEEQSASMVGRIKRWIENRQSASGVTCPGRAGATADQAPIPTAQAK